MVVQERQMEFPYVAMDAPCRTCCWFWRRYGTRMEGQVNDKWYYGCHMGGFKMTSSLLKLPHNCEGWRLGGERMPLQELQKLHREEVELVERAKEGTPQKARGVGSTGDKQRRKQCKVIL